MDRSVFLGKYCLNNRLVFSLVLRCHGQGHRHLIAKGLNDTHVDVIIELLGATLKELGVQDADIAEVAAIANSVRDDVLDR